GDNVVLFAEGTSSDGNRVLPFKTSLFGAAKPGKSTPGAGEDGDVVVQPMAIAYTGHHGLPLSRRERPMVAWYGDMELAGHAWELLKSGPLEVRISIGTPVPLTDFADRKDLARYTEVHVRHQMAALLRHQTPGAARQPGPDATTAGLQDQVGSAMESGRDAATDERRTSRPSTVG
ncbi:MAG: lysophospholipid acyltransferase family protein, partial [Hyphomicrobiaceae bacterium]